MTTPRTTRSTTPRAARSTVQAATTSRWPTWFTRRLLRAPATARAATRRLTRSRRRSCAPTATAPTRRPCTMARSSRSQATPSASRATAPTRPSAPVTRTAAACHSNATLTDYLKNNYTSLCSDCHAVGAGKVGTHAYTPANANHSTGADTPTHTAVSMNTTMDATYSFDVQCQSRSVNSPSKTPLLLVGRGRACFSFQLLVASFQFQVFSIGSQGFDQAMEHGGKLFELDDEFDALFAAQDTDAFSNSCLGSELGGRAKDDQRSTIDELALL